MFINGHLKCSLFLYSSLSTVWVILLFFYCTRIGNQSELSIYSVKGSGLTSGLIFWSFIWLANSSYGEYLHLYTHTYLSNGPISYFSRFQRIVSSIYPISHTQRHPLSYFLTFILSCFWLLTCWIMVDNLVEASKSHGSLSGRKNCSFQFCFWEILSLQSRVSQHDILARWYNLLLQSKQILCTISAIKSIPATLYAFL